MAVPIDGMGTKYVKAVKALPVPGVQKSPHQVGIWFRDRLGVAPEEKEKKPAGLKTRPTWLQQDRLGANLAVCHDDAGCEAWRPRPCKP